LRTEKKIQNIKNYTLWISTFCVYEFFFPNDDRVCYILRIMTELLRCKVSYLNKVYHR